MLFSNLLPEILDTVISFAIDGYAHTLYDWKQHLPILAVCRNWRVVGVRRVYCTAIIESRYAVQPLAQTHTSRNSNPLVTVVVSNIDLAAAVTAWSLMKKLVLNMDDNIRLVHYIDKVLQLIHRHMQVWPNLTQLWLLLRSYSNRQDWSGKMSVEEKINEQTRQLMTTLPNIKYISADVMSGNGSSIQVMNALVDNYAHQLTHMSCSHWVNFIAPQFSRNLSCLSILDRPNHSPLPKVNLDTLTMLTIFNIELECQRGTFYSASNCEAKWFEFKSLKYLNLKDSGEADVPKYSSLYSKLYFPSLSVLDLNMIHKTDRLLTQSHFPEYIDKLVVRSPIYGFITLYRVKFGIDERIQLSQYTKDGTGLHFLDFAKYYLKNHYLYSEMQAGFSTRTMYLVNQLHQFDGLQTLVLPEANIPQLIQVVVDIRLLKLLTVGMLMKVVEPPEYIDILDDELLPITSLLEHVKIKSIEGNVDQTFASLFEKLLVRTLSLKWLEVPKDVQVCSSLVNQFKTEYPHIQQLHISAKY